MRIQDFMLHPDYELVQFSFSLVRDVEQKLRSKHLFYENQVKNYVKDQINAFIIKMNVKKALSTVYKAELHMLVKHRLDALTQRYSLLKCV